MVDAQRNTIVSEHQPFAMWYHALYTNGIHPNARFPRNRYELLRERLETSEAMNKMVFNVPQAISEEHLLLAHGQDYVQRFLAGKLTDKEQKRIGLTPWTPAMIERTLVLTGGALEATEYALEHRTFSGNMAGGTHHAHRDFGSGYCVFNDLAICAVHAIENLGVERVAILDLDVHQGDGTATILADEPRVCTISVHCSTNFPFRKSKSDYDLPVEPGSDDASFLETVERALTICKDFNPELLLYQAGVDGLEQDALGKLNVSRQGMRRRNHLVFSVAKERNIPLVLFMGGGYSKPIDATLDAFYDLFHDAALWNSSADNQL